MILATRTEAQIRELLKLEKTDWNVWNPHNYLTTYFSKLGPDSIENLRFLIAELRNCKDGEYKKVLDFGSGPTIFTGLVVANYANEIHFSDYLQSNLFYIKKWLINDSNAFKWEECARMILEMEGKIPSENFITERFILLRKRAKKLIRCDASFEYPLESAEGRYPLIISNFCADSATSSKEVWGTYMHNIYNLLDCEGKILISALRKCSKYKVGNDFFPSANLDENDVFTNLMLNGFEPDKIKIRIAHVPECESEGFTSLIFATAIKG